LSEAGSRFSFPGLRTASFRAGVALVGKHFEREEKAIFDEIAIGASDLNAWTQVSGFATRLEAESLRGIGQVQERLAVGEGAERARYP